MSYVSGPNGAAAGFSCQFCDGTPPMAGSEDCGSLSPRLPSKGIVTKRSVAPGMFGLMFCG